MKDENLIPLHWKLSHSKDKNLPQEPWINATVPGAAQDDLARHLQYPSLAIAENARLYEWMEDLYFFYKASFSSSGLSNYKNLFIYSLGIDYECEIYLNNQLLLSHKGMYTPHYININKHLKENNTLLIIIYPAPKNKSMPRGRFEANQAFKPAVSYGWDFHPRLVPTGLWQDCGLMCCGDSYLHEVHYNVVLDASLQKGLVNLQFEGKLAKADAFVWRLYEPDGNVLFERELTTTENMYAEVLRPKLWWPNGYGEQHLYESIIEYNGLVLSKRKIGFKHIKIVMNEGAWKEPSTFPKSRSVAPAQFVINGKKIFVKGTNIVPLDIFYAKTQKDDYGALLELCKQANFCMVRLWGGGTAYKQSFYDLCNELGLMVWFEFPLACNAYEDTPEYLQTLQKEAGALIRRVNTNVALSLFCGGNELFNFWSGMHDQSLALRTLNALCLQWAPSIPFIATSPLEGMGHGHYVFKDDATGEEVFSLMNRSKETAYTEFGVSSPANIDILQKIIPKDELWPIEKGKSWEFHHAFNAWQGDTWLRKEMLENYFGTIESLNLLVDLGQLLQGEGYKYIFEEARRQKPYCSMALNWCMNEPWPTAANNSLLCHPYSPKKSFMSVVQSCRKVQSSARYAKFSYNPGEIFVAELWMLNDTLNEIPAGTISAYLFYDEEKEFLLEWRHNKINANENLQGPSVRIKLPEIDGLFRLELDHQHANYNSSYTFLMVQKPALEADGAVPIMNL